MPRKVFPWGISSNKISQFDPGVWALEGGASDFEHCASSISGTGYICLTHQFSNKSSPLSAPKSWLPFQFLQPNNCNSGREGPQMIYRQATDDQQRVKRWSTKLTPKKFWKKKKHDKIMLSFLLPFCFCFWIIQLCGRQALSHLHSLNYRKRRIIRCAAKIRSTPPYSLNRWGYLVYFWAESTSGGYKWRHHGDFWISVSDRKLQFIASFLGGPKLEVLPP